MEELIITLPVDYGYTELKKSYKRYMLFGLLFGLIFVSTAVSAYWLTVYLTRDDEPVAYIRLMKYSELGPPPSITNNDVAQSIAVSGPAVKPTVGIPVPVPDAQVSPEQTIATQQELAAQGGTGEGGGGGQVLQDVSVKEEQKQEMNIDDGPPPDFVAVEKEPVPIKSPQPKYPDIAQRSGMEGTVYLKLWVDKEGKVKKAVVLKSDGEVFNEPAIEAGKQWLFTPAQQQGQTCCSLGCHPLQIQVEIMQPAGKIQEAFGYGIAVITVSAGVLALTGVGIPEYTPGQVRVMFGVVLILLGLYRASITFARSSQRRREITRGDDDE